MDKSRNPNTLVSHHSNTPVLQYSNAPPATGNLALIRSALGLGPREHIALVGAGGKTSLLFALARELQDSGRRVVTTTTTKIRHEESLDAPIRVFIRGEPSWKERIREGLERERHVFLGERVLDWGKVKGVEPSLLDLLYHGATSEYILVEADGSAGHPVKAPAGHEPVIPSSATLVVALIGLEAVGGRLEPELVFRQEEFSKVTGLEQGEDLSASALSRLFLEPQGLYRGSPGSARRVAFLNKADMARDRGEVEELARRILEDDRREIQGVVIGSVKKGLYESFRRA